jgi:integrase
LLNLAVKQNIIKANPIVDKHLNKPCEEPNDKIKELGGFDNKLHIYALRHNFASWLVMNGVYLFTVSKLTVHSKISTIIDNYAHLAPNKASECTQTLVSGFMGKPQRKNRTLD